MRNQTPTITPAIAAACERAKACRPMRVGDSFDTLTVSDLRWAVISLPAHIVRRYAAYAATRGVYVTVTGRRRVIVTVYHDGTHGAEYWEGGQLHRPAGDGPAVMWTCADGTRMEEYEEYWERGQRHRPASDGPAYVRVFPDREREVRYYERGEHLNKER